jgi:ankyrin repeat protein
MAPSVRKELDSSEDVFLQDSLGPTVAEHATQCNRLFVKYMAMPEIARDPTLIDDQLARFKLWASNMDVFGPSNISLDYRLRYSPTVVQIIHQLLDVICNSLESLKRIDNAPRLPSRKRRRISTVGVADRRFDDDSSDSDSGEDQAQRNDHLITFTIGGTVTRLLRLSNAVRKSAKASRTYKIEEYTADEEANNAITELRLYTQCYIRFRFPNVPEALCSTLVEANALRLRRLYYQRSHRRRIALSVQRPQADPENIVQLPKMPESLPAVRFAPIMQPKSSAIGERSNTTSVPPAPLTYATTARQTTARALYADSVVGTPRAKSVLVNNKLSFPPIPTTNECPYCGVIIEFKGSTKSIIWNDHVVRDLEPFVCIFANCTHSSQQAPGSTTFETSKAWMNHMQNAHGYAWECRAPSHSPILFEQEVEFQEHSRKEHGVPEAHVGILSGAARRPVVRKIQECPFGDDFEVQQNPESNTIFSNEALHLHVAAHMKEIALLALQKLPSDDDGKPENVASDAPVEEDGPARRRESMYSILDDEALDFNKEAGDGVSNSTEDAISVSVNKLDFEDRDAAGMTMLHRAVQDNDLTLVKSLIGQGANLRIRANHGRIALHYASLNSDKGVNMMKLLLSSEQTEIMSFTDDNGQTPLHYAVKKDFIDGIQLLVENGAFIDLPDQYEYSPYLWAVISGQYRATELLLSLGVDVNSTSTHRKSALSWAANMGHSEIAELLVTKGADVMLMTQNTQLVPLEEAAASGDLSTVRLLIKSGADPNYRDRDGWSAIHWAAEEGYYEVVSVLLKHGANVNGISSYGTSPLHCAANGGHNEIVNELLQYGANPLMATCHGWTPLHHAAFMGHSHVIQSLLDSDERVSSSFQDNHGWTALHLAVHMRHLNTVRVLLGNPTISESRLQGDGRGLIAEEWLDLGMDSHYYKTISKVSFGNSRCCRAVTGLRQAAREGNIVITELLLEQGNSVHDTNSGRRTALYYAAKKGHSQILDVLLRNGADPNFLPAGLKTWEEFISDDTTLQRLRQAGYMTPGPSPEMDHQIRRTLRERGESYTLHQSSKQDSEAYTLRTSSTQDSQVRGFEGSEPVRRIKSPRSPLVNLWKRFRRQ